MTNDTQSPRFLAALSAFYNALDGNSQGISAPLFYSIKAWENYIPTNENNCVQNQETEL